MKKILCLLVITFLTFSCNACQKNYYNPDEQTTQVEQRKIEINEITLNYKKLSLDIGKTLVLVAKISPDYASKKPICYKSTNEKILSVNGRGVVFAKKEGSASIVVFSAENEDMKAKCDITVLPLRKAIITGNVPMSSEPGVIYTVKVSFENCFNPSVKIITDCSGGKINGENETIHFGSKPYQCQVMGNTTISFSISKLKNINYIRILCFDNGDIIDCKEYDVMLPKKE